MACKHYDCICYNPETESCDYIIIFGRRRGIPGDECHLCLHGFDEEHMPIIKGARPRLINQVVMKKMETVYSPDKQIRDMARESGFGKDKVIKWVKKVHPEFDNWGALSFR